MAAQLLSRHHDVAHRLLAETERRLLAVLDSEADAWRASDPDAVDLVCSLRDFVARGGKRLRPAFAVWGYLGANGHPDNAAIVDLAAALELLHAFALVHDDVMDGSATRRSHPSVNACFEAHHRRAGGAGEARRYGEAMAVLVGDLALVLAERLLLDAPQRVRMCWHEMQLELVRGQTLDLHAAAHRRVDVARSRRIAVIKSGRYSVVHPLVLGALAAGRDDLRETYAAFGEPVGEAFQLRDDLIGAFGSAAETGKPAGDDLRDGKATMLLATAFERAGIGERRVLQLAGTTDCGDATVVEIQRVLERCGARAAVERRIDELAAVGLDALERLPIDSEARHALHQLTLAALWRRT